MMGGGGNWGRCIQNTTCPLCQNILANMNMRFESKPEILIGPPFYSDPLQRRKPVKNLERSRHIWAGEKNKGRTHRTHMRERCLLTRASSRRAEKESVWRGSRSPSIRDEDITLLRGSGGVVGGEERSTLTTCFRRASRGLHTKQ